MTAYSLVSFILFLRLVLISLCLSFKNLKSLVVNICIMFCPVIPPKMSMKIPCGYSPFSDIISLKLMPKSPFTPPTEDNPPMRLPISRPWIICKGLKPCCRFPPCWGIGICIWNCWGWGWGCGWWCWCWWGCWCWCWCWCWWCSWWCWCGCGCWDWVAGGRFCTCGISLPIGLVLCWVGVEFDKTVGCWDCWLVFLFLI